MSEQEHGPPSFSLADRLGLSIEEAAQAISVSERHLREILPEIPHVHIGRRVIIPVDDLRRWLQERANAEKGRAEAVVDDVLQSLRESGKD